MGYKDVMKYGQEFVEFLNSSPSPFHAVHNIKRQLLANGFKELKEGQEWSYKNGFSEGYFVTRNDSSIVAFRVPSELKVGAPFAVTGAHTDSPALKIKPISKRKSEKYLQVGVECYGGGIWHSWFDSDLSMAGRVITREGGRQFKSRLIDIKKPLLKVPTLAIHLDRTVNEKFTFNKESELLPIAGLDIQESGTKSQKGCCQGNSSEQDSAAFTSIKPIIERHHKELVDLIVSELELKSADDIEDFELYLYDHKPSCLGGLKEEFVFSGRLDNLTSCFTSVKALVEASSSKDHISMVACFDHEEVGSLSAQGADSNFLPAVMDKVKTLLKPDELATTNPNPYPHSLFLSSDVAHGVHPNYANRYESQHKPQLGQGTVIKINSNQRYMTNSIGLTFVKLLADQAKVPLQLFVVANDSPCGSTIGPMIAAKTGIRTLDLGNPILSMHSIRETGAVADLGHQILLFKQFFETYKPTDFLE